MEKIEDEINKKKCKVIIDKQWGYAYINLSSEKIFQLLVHNYVFPTGKK